MADDLISFQQSVKILRLIDQLVVKHTTMTHTLIELKRSLVQHIHLGRLRKSDLVRARAQLKRMQRGKR